MAVETFSVGEQTAELALVLGQLAPALSRMSEGFAELRQALSGSAEHVLDLAGEQEEATAHVAYLEHRRLRVQKALESALDVQGLGAILDAVAEEDTEDHCLDRIVEEIRRELLRLQDERSRTLSLLKSLMEITARSRAHLLTQTGAEPSYAPPLVRSAVPVRRVVPMETVAAL